MKQIVDLMNKKGKLAERVKKIIESDASEEIKNEAKNVGMSLEDDIPLEWKKFVKCSERQYVEYLQRILDTIKNSYGML